VKDFALLQGQLLLHFDLAVLADELDADLAGLVHGEGLFAGEEVTAAHVVCVRLGGHAPLAHRVRVFTGIGLDCGGGAAVGVAFTQNRVYCTAQYLAVASADLVVGVALRVFREVGNLVALSLELGDRALELGDRGADVGQLDDVGFRRGGQLCQVSKIILNLAVEFVCKGGQDTGAQRDIAGFDVYVCGGSEGFYDGEKRVSGEGGGFVGEGVGNLRAIGHQSWTLSCGAGTDLEARRIR